MSTTREWHCLDLTCEGWSGAGREAALDHERLAHEGAAVCMPVDPELDAYSAARSAGATREQAQAYRKAERLAGIEAAANLLSEKLAAAPPAVVEPIVGDGSLYLTDANGTVYVADQADVWDAPEDSRRVTVYYEDEQRPDDAVPLYRITTLIQPGEPPAEVDLMEQCEASLAAARPGGLEPAEGNAAALAPSAPLDDGEPF